jgi:hypothetical protein
MSKPAHRGRILVSSRLPNLTEQQNGSNRNQRSGNPQPPVSAAMNARRGSGSKSADVKKGILIAAGTSALGGMSKDKLQRRVSELEFENQKLQTNLEKAELSIESYRGFLSAKSAQRSHSIAIQTDFLGESNSTSKITPNKKTQLTKITNKLEEAKAKIQQLNQEISAFQEKAKAREDDYVSLQSQYKSLKMNMELSEVSYKAQIHTLERDLRALVAAEGHAGQHSPTVRTPTQSQSTQKPKHTPQSLSLQGNTLSTPSKKLPKVQVPPSTGTPPTSWTTPPPGEPFISPAPSMNKLKALSSNKKHPSAPIQSIEKAKPLLSITQSLLICKKRILSHNSQYRTINNAISQDFEEFNDFFRQCLMKIIHEIDKSKKHQEMMQTKHTSKISSLQKELSTAKKNQDDCGYAATATATASLDMEKRLADAQAAHDRELTAAQTAADQERDRADSLDLLYEAKLNEKEADISNLSTLFTTVSRELQNLHAKFKSESAAVKHMGHCKDLVRVATIRELNLDKDRAFSELKYARWVNNGSYCDIHYDPPLPDFFHSRDKDEYMLIYPNRNCGRFCFILIALLITIIFGR